MATTVTLVAEAVQGQVVRTGTLPTVAATTAAIDLLSSVFGNDASLSFSLLVEESFDSGVTWKPASGFPATAGGGQAGVNAKNISGLLSVHYHFDGTARMVRATGTPSPAAFDWGLTVTLP